ncbi:MAG TPA: tetratricopeptide repeat protein, partial [Phenylobacterium sp.]|nr:tetratricopeptide repeat protein [Phenylobacterium sp.]
MPTAADPMELASALHLLGRVEEAQAAYRQILEHRPDHRAARKNLIDLLSVEERWDAAEAVIREGAILFPADQDMQFRLAISVLARGDFAQGWQLYEGRRGAAASNGVIPPMLSLREWDGGPVERLLVWPEQGFGDLIQFARLLPQLERRGIAPTLLAPPEVARLFAAAGLNVVSLEDGAKIAEQQAWVLIGSLPWRLDLTEATLPPPLAIQVAPHGPTGGVGFVGRGRAAHKNDANRSLPQPILEAMLKLPGVVSLEPADTYASDFLETAQIVAGLDHVITVDTAVAHLAGSMGKPVSVLIPRLNTDWRWMHERTDSPWYPSMKLYRQAAAGRWRPVLDEVLGDLGDLVLRPAPARPRPEIVVAPARPAPQVPTLPPVTAAPTPAAAPPLVAPQAAASALTAPEAARRKTIIAAGDTDRRRWEDAAQLEPAWNKRAELAAAYVPRGARVLDLGCGAMALERVLPAGCVYIPCDLVVRDPRTIVCDFNAGEFPTDVASDVVTVLGVLEYLHDAPAFLRKLAARGQPVVLSYNVAGGRGPADRGALGWVNHFTHPQLVGL